MAHGCSIQEKKRGMCKHFRNFTEYAPNGYRECTGRGRLTSHQRTCTGIHHPSLLSELHPRQALLCRCSRRLAFQQTKNLGRQLIATVLGMADVSGQLMKHRGIVELVALAQSLFKTSAGETPHPQGDTPAELSQYHWRKCRYAAGAPLLMLMLSGPTH